MNNLTELDFQIAVELGIGRFELKPKNPNVKTVLFYSPECIHCREFIEKKKGTFYAVNVLDAPLLSSHFNIKQVPREINFP